VPGREAVSRSDEEDEMNYVGQAMRRFEDPRLVTGNRAFVCDIILPDMLHAAVLRSQHAHVPLRVVVCAAATVALLRGAAVAEPVLMNTCYSLVAPNYGISITAVYRVAGDKIAAVEGSEGISPVDAPNEVRQREAEYAQLWYANITADVFTCARYALLENLSRVVPSPLAGEGWDGGEKGRESARTGFPQWD
jgi:hypothetical protein